MAFDKISSFNQLVDSCKQGNIIDIGLAVVGDHSITLRAKIYHFAVIFKEKTIALEPEIFTLYQGDPNKPEEKPIMDLGTLF